MTDLKTLQEQKPSLHQVYIEVFPVACLPANSLDCVWALSTGRCGTLTLSQLLDLSPTVIAMHEPMPRLWDLYMESYLRPNDELYDKIIYTSRIDIVSSMAYLGYAYAETSHRLTFFAPNLKRVFSKSKFIYIRRPMDDVVRSAYLWGWYDPTMDRWVNMRPIPSQRPSDRANLLAWYWCVVNEFVTEFVASLPKEDWFFLDFEDIKTGNIDRFFEMYDWLGVSRPEEGHIEGVLMQRFNRGKNKELYHIKKTWGEYDEREARLLQT